MTSDLLLINGDSYSVLESGKTYGQHLGDLLDLPVIDLAVVGANNSRILRSTVEKIIDLRSQGLTPLVILAWSFLTRNEIWYDGEDQQIIDCIPDRYGIDKHRSSRLVTLDFVIKNDEINLEYKSLIANTPKMQKLLVDFYLGIYLLSMFLKSCNIPYRFFFGADHQDFPISDFPYVASLDFVKHCQSDTSMYRLDQFSISSWAVDNDPECSLSTGHLSASGHEIFSQWLISNLNLAQYQKAEQTD